MPVWVCRMLHSLTVGDSMGSVRQERSLGCSPVEACTRTAYSSYLGRVRWRFREGEAGILLCGRRCWSSGFLQREFWTLAWVPVSQIRLTMATLELTLPLLACAWLHCSLWAYHLIGPSYLISYVHKHTCMHTHTHIHTDLHIHMHIYIHPHTCTHTYIHADMHTHTYKQTYTYRYTHTYTDTHT